MKQPFVSIIVVSYNSEKDIVPCFKSLEKQTYKNFDIIFVDNNSKDNSVKVAKRFNRTKIIENKINRGFAGGNNVGFLEALHNKKVKYICCLNLDTTVDKNWLKELVILAEKDRRVGSIQSKILMYNQQDMINTSGNAFNYLGISYCGGYLDRSSEYKKNREIFYSSGASVLYSRKALEKVGFFDEDLFMYHEDLDLGWRLLLQNYKNLFCYRSVAYHNYSFSKNPKKYYFLERNRLLVNFKNYGLKSLILILPLALIFELGMLLHSIQNNFFIEKIKSYGGFITKIPSTIKKRRIIQKERVLSDRDISYLFDTEIKSKEIKSSFLDKVGNPIIKGYWGLIGRFL